ncbi:MAG: peptide ABC transporter substrate-binding protein [Clostridiales bacterium]|nr:peptide ABC transporter substrate-binding protein [Clostridiales bacterium]
MAFCYIRYLTMIVAVAIFAFTLISATACTLEDDLSQTAPASAAATDGNESVTADNSGDVIDSGPVKGGTLNMFSTIPDTLDPLTTKNSYVHDFLSLVYEGLVKLDAEQKPVSVLSDDWTVSADGLTWNFHIRNGITWQDGMPLDASDVEYTVGYLLNASTDSPYKSLLQNIATYAAVDDYNFSMVLRKPDSFTAEHMTFPILPAHMASSLEENAAKTSYVPIGTGPYKFDSYSMNKEISLKANKSWWNLANLVGTSEAEQYIETIAVKLYESSSDSLNAFQSYDVDMISIDCYSIGSYTGRTDLNIRKFSSREYEFLSFNTTKGVFSDQAARQAVNAAIDTDAIITEVMRGNAEKSILPVLPDSWLAKAYDINKSYVSAAKGTPSEILVSGGWKKNDDGYYKSFNGVRKYLQFEILVNNNNSLRISACKKIVEQLASAGIKASVKLVSWDELLNLSYSAKYDMAFLGVRVPQYPDISYLYSNSYISSLTVVGTESGRNVSGYNDIELNSKIDGLYSELDTEKQKSIYNRMVNIIREDVPYVGLYFTSDAVLFRKSVRGDPSPDTWNKFEGITGWYVTAN